MYPRFVHSMYKLKIEDIGEYMKGKTIRGEGLPSKAGGLSRNGPSQEERGTIPALRGRVYRWRRIILFYDK